jgi:hypothetical protein
MKVRVVAYKGKIVIVPLEPEKGTDDGWFPAGQGRVGCVLLDTKKQLGVSEEAFALMRGIQRNHDAIGDISWWEADDGTQVFGWFGSIHRVIDPKTAEAARDCHVTNRLRGHFTVIPNEVPEAAKLVIDQNPEAYAWAEPHSIP